MSIFQKLDSLGLIKIKMENKQKIKIAESVSLVVRITAYLAIRIINIIIIRHYYYYLYCYYLEKKEIAAVKNKLEGRRTKKKR